jgi:hypothetical protein
LVELPQHVKYIGCSWAYKIKWKWLISCGHTNTIYTLHVFKFLNGDI